MILNLLLSFLYFIHTGKCGWMQTINIALEITRKLRCPFDLCSSMFIIFHLSLIIHAFQLLQQRIAKNSKTLGLIPEMSNLIKDVL